MNFSRRLDPRLVPPLLVALGLLVLSGVGAVWAARSKSAVPQPEAVVRLENTYPEIERIGLAEARQAYDRGEAVFVDVRDPVSYKARHIPRALNIPLGEIENYVKDLDPQAWIILYCT